MYRNLVVVILESAFWAPAAEATRQSSYPATDLRANLVSAWRGW